MDVDVQVDEMVLKGTNFTQESVEPIKIQFIFEVTSEEYHDVTTLLYKNEFDVTVREMDLAFHATITNYSTSITNLYKDGEVGTFYLELTEKLDLNK